ncbi:hypothetical protein L2E82_28418 [Cichorium intybus]|uniref:Uncharacterized protein n=1 Tax=Cichorium intybus TaxID=13427 RepID=A0ACB9CW31_CICIN|nr:hypothetical protein L2E82_28418 [Cichorium intybus]
MLSWCIGFVSLVNGLGMRYHSHTEPDLHVLQQSQITKDAQNVVKRYNVEATPSHVKTMEKSRIRNPYDDICDAGGRRGGGHNVDEDDGDEDDDCGGDVDGDDGDPFFMAIISKYHKFTMRLPVEFARWAGIDAARTISMKNLDGKEWPMSLQSESGRYERYHLSAGWSDFQRANQLSKGDPAGKVPVAEVSRKKRGRPSRVGVERKDDGAKEVNRPRW